MKEESLSIKIRNYRNFNEASPIELKIKNGITFILGVNNIGKSNLLRLFYEFKEYFSYSPIKSGETHHRLGGNFKETVFSEICSQGSNNRFVEIVINNSNTYKIVFTPRGERGEDYNQVNLYLEINSKSVEEISLDDLGMIADIFNNSIHLGSHRTPFFSKNKNRLYNMSNADSFVSQWDNWSKGTVQQRRSIKELVKDIKHILGFSELNINTDKETIFITNEDGAFRLDELGAGISHVVMSLANTTFYEPAFILIDEPENSLHPRLQEAFVQALSSRASKGLIATTHSMSLARSIGDHIYTLTKRLDGLTPKYDLSNYREHSHKDISRMVLELGYSRFLDIGGSHILLVEGRTDIKVFKELLNKLEISDEVIVLDLGGAEFITDKIERIDTGLEEIKRLGAESYSIIIDSDLLHSNDELDEKKRTFVKICSDLNYNVFTTDYHSTENYITQKALDIHFGVGQKQALTQYEQFSSLPKEKKWGKVDNWKLFQKMSLEDIEDTELGRFLIELKEKVISS